jgi:hypothetical protein
MKAVTKKNITLNDENTVYAKKRKTKVKVQTCDEKKTVQVENPGSSQYCCDASVEKEFVSKLEAHHIIFDREYEIDNHQLWHGPWQVNKKNMVRYYISRYYKQACLPIQQHVIHISTLHDNLPPIVFNKSSYHWEIDFNWTGNNSNNSVNKNANDESVLEYFNNYFCKTCNMDVEQFKILVFFNAHRLTLNNQKMILRIMENTFRNVKFIIVCDHVHKIDCTVKSRCINIRIPCEFDGFCYHIGHDLSENKFIFYKFKHPLSATLYATDNTPLSSVYRNSTASTLGLLANKHIAEIISTGGTQWKGDNEQQFLQETFVKIIQLKKGLDGGSLCFRKRYQEILERFDQYSLACHTVPELLTPFLYYIYDDMIATHGNKDETFALSKLSRYAEKFAEMEHLSTRSEYQTYILENCLTFFLLN